MQNERALLEAELERVKQKIVLLEETEVRLLSMRVIAQDAADRKLDQKEISAYQSRLSELEAEVRLLSADLNIT
ncbi:hypothetical protein [Petrocella sp. FN5]|uniref:hypothetical protein n=1 Tax=Petrocella sp. FN5 TaxID=3032002 RepID=UPI0023DAF2B6|nr:hypothetical protein [Petrocella sp. FN5]MDF1615994.1 hypothetical protein [Petrocella sp. FN5]